jgi:hypothetical protein
LQLPHPFHLHSEIAAHFSDLAFDSIRQCGRSTSALCPPRAAYDCRLRHSIPSHRSYPDKPEHRCMFCLERNAPPVRFRVSGRIELSVRNACAAPLRARHASVRLTAFTIES